MKNRSALEERMIACGSESAFKAAKQLLKNKMLQGAYRDGENRLHAVFEEKDQMRCHTALMLGETPRSECDCAFANSPDGKKELCEHALALWLHSLLFRVPERTAEVDNDVANYSGLKNAGLEALGAECATPSGAQLCINAESAFPHVPSKWENATLAVRLKAGTREYLGNLNNLRKLYFDKMLTVALHLEDLSLQDRQIVRFLAISGEAENSCILLNSELTSELFHALGGFDRFFRNGRRIIVHTEANACPVVLEKRVGSRTEYSSGIRFRGALLEIHSAKVITGRSGCWIGKAGEYFWIPATCEIGFLRNFFRLGAWNDSTPGCAGFLAGVPFERVRFAGREVEGKQPVIQLAGAWAQDALQLNLRFVYDDQSFPPDAGRLVPGAENRFWLRNEALEQRMVTDLKLLHAEGDFSRGVLTVQGLENIGTFLDAVLPAWLSRYPDFMLNPALARLAAGCSGLEDLEYSCTGDARLNHQGNYLFCGFWHDRTGGRIRWSQVLELAKKNSRYLRLDNGRMVRLPAPAAESIVHLEKLIQKLDDEQGTFELPHLALHYYRYLMRHWQYAVPEPLQGMGSEIVPEGSSIRPSSAKLHAELRNYQQAGVEWMRRMLSNNFNVILADEMGLGKTVQALAVLNSLRSAGDAPGLVVCPASLVENWQRECARFLPDYQVAAITGGSRESVMPKLSGYDLVIASYTLARLELAKLSKQLFTLVILDEAQHIKNPGTANAHTCKSLKAKHKLVLTGTPLENSPEDLWSIFDFLHPGFLGSFNSFKKQYADIAESAELRNDLAARIAPFIKRRNKLAVAPELPEREERPTFCNMEADQRRLYHEILCEGREQLRKLETEPEKRPSHGNMEILTTLLRLRQVCCHPALLGEKYKQNSGKFELLQELIHEHLDSHHKMLIFSQFTSVLALIRSWLDASGIRYAYLDGATRGRQAVVDGFNNTPEIPIFLLSLKAGGTGLNLTSADTVIIYDPWWNPAAELQAADRTHRIGQTKPVRIIKLLVNDSIEEKILRLQERKKELFDQVVDNPVAAAEKLSMEEIKFLLQ